MAANKLIYQFRVELLEIEPSIWRRIQVPASYSFWDLHVAIQDSMGWLDYHLHEFHVKRPHTRKMVEIGIPDTGADRNILAGWEVPISAYFVEPGATATYNYDFGDGWHHKVLLEGILLADASLKYPVCVGGERACPPEDCGGMPGYERLLKVLSKPRTGEYADTVAWLKGHAKNYYPYQPDHFVPGAVEFWNPAKRWKIAFGKNAQREF